MSCLVYLWHVAIPRNMELFDIASTSVRGQTEIKCIQSTTKGGSLYCAFNARCFIAHLVWTDQRAFIAHLNVRFFCIV